MFPSRSIRAGAWDGSLAPFMHRAPTSPTVASKKKFTEHEDRFLLHLVTVQGIRDWKSIALHMQGRTVRQCRERFKYYLEPGLDRPSWSKAEDQLLMEKFEAFGPHWAQIVLFFPGRTDIDLKNRYNRIRRSQIRGAERTDRKPPEIHEMPNQRPKLPSLIPGADNLTLLPLCEENGTSPTPTPLSDYIKNTR
jgi:hypothetical protein